MLSLTINIHPRIRKILTLPKGYINVCKIRVGIVIIQFENAKCFIALKRYNLVMFYTFGGNFKGFVLEKGAPNATKYPESRQKYYYLSRF